MKKNAMVLPLLSLFPVLLAGCQGNPGNEGDSQKSEPKKDDASLAQPKTFDGDAYYKDVGNRVGFESGTEVEIEEDFSSGKLNDANWWALDGYWDAGGASDWHNGVRSRNLFYVKDGSKTYLGVRARGSYCEDQDLAKAKSGMTKPEGACIMSKKFLYPGRYEIKMKAMPRQGAVTAMWTYYSKTGNEATSQNEIDIELGGEGQYSSEWCTTWTTHTDKQTNNVDLSSRSYINDGEFHTYTFDWYTDFPLTHEKRVDWFFDGELISSIEGTAVPEMAMPLWVGLWCPSWAGTASFDTEYMIIDSLSYRPFSFQTQYVTEAKGNPAYSHVDPSKASIQTIPYSQTQNKNKLNNASFETLQKSIADGTSYSGWDALSGNGKVEQSDDATAGSKSILIEDDGQGTYVGQTLPLAYPGYRYKLSIDAKKESSAGEAYLEIVYGKKNKEKKTIPLEGDGWKSYEAEIQMASGAKELSINLCHENGAKAKWDNASLLFLGK